MTKVTDRQAYKIGSSLGIDFNKISLQTFIKGMNVELEHGSNNKLTNVTNDDLLMTGKIALAHLLEIPDYYERLSVMEKEAFTSWSAYSDQDKYNMIMRDNTESVEKDDKTVTYTLLGLTLTYFFSIIF